MEAYIVTDNHSDLMLRLKKKETENCTSVPSTSGTLCLGDVVCSTVIWTTRACAEIAISVVQCQVVSCLKHCSGYAFTRAVLSTADVSSQDCNFGTPLCGPCELRQPAMAEGAFKLLFTANKLLIILKRILCISTAYEQFTV